MMMGGAVIRVRSRDGMERVHVPPSATVADLQMSIERELQVPVGAQRLSRNQSILLVKDANAASSVSELRDPSAALASLGITHGSMVFLFYSGERAVVGPKPKLNSCGGFGKKMTIDDMIAMQTRIERQENPHCTALSCDRDAANSFQLYVHEALAFGVKRAGFMYGRVSEQGDVWVDFIYEPPQQGSEENVLLLRSPEEEKRVEVIAAGMGMTRVGFIFTQSISQAKQEYTLSSAEIRQAAELQSESHLKSWCIAVVKMDESCDVHFEAFQLSDQCIKLWKDGWFVDDASGLDPKTSRMKKDVVILGKDTRDVDNHLFLVPTKILDHEGPLSCTFPIENRLTLPSSQALRQHLDRTKSSPYVQRISDFHLIFFLANFLDVNDVACLAELVASRSAVPDGYQLLIESFANNV